jgi:hypothetical protein
MVGHFSVIQYIPNPISGECVNIGVIVFDERTVRAKFLTNWARVKKFANADITFLKDFSEEIDVALEEQLQLPFMEDRPLINGEIITRMAAKWTNSIQLTAPRASLKPLDALLENISVQFLTQPTHGQRYYRTRATAAKLVKAYLRHALEESEGRERVAKYLHSSGNVEGRFGPHTFDSVIANGTPFVAVHGLSFELPKADQLGQLINSVAFEVYDVREKYPQLPIGIMALRPTGGRKSLASQIYGRARKTYEGLNATVLSENEADDWMREQIRQIHWPE